MMVIKRCGGDDGDEAMTLLISFPVSPTQAYIHGYR